MRFLLIFLISFNVFGQASNPNDTLKLGKASSSADKGLIFDTNDGVLNKTLKVNPTSKALIFTGNDVQMGDGATGNDKELILDPSSGAALRWNGTKGKIQFTNDGSVAKDIGSGSGGGTGGINGITADQNAGAEDGLAGWTASAGTFALDSSDPLVGENSFTWVPAAQNDTLDSSVLVFDKDAFKGRSCEARIEYVGGDENLTLQVIDADDDILGEQVLPAHSIAGSESVFFLCPSQADITASANNGNLRLRLLNAGASASVLIKFDSAYVGTLIGLVEMTLPDEFGARLNGSTGAVIANYGSTITTCSRTGIGIYFCNMTGLTQTPVCVATPEIPGDTNRSHAVNDINPNSFQINTFVAFGTPAFADVSYVHVKCNKTGADAKQSVQVYKSIPKAADNVNEFSARIASFASLSFENVPWVDSVSKAVTGRYEITVNSGVFSSTPVCVASIESSGGGEITVDFSDFASSRIINVAVWNSSAILIDRSFNINCGRGLDYKTPTVQPVIVGQVVNSFAESSSRNMAVENCLIANAGTPIANDTSCFSWVDSITDQGTGTMTINIKSGVFSRRPNCVCNGNSTGGVATICASRNNTVSDAVVRTWNSSGTVVDESINIVCVGEK